jgi:hypothetical protein
MAVYFPKRGEPKHIVFDIVGKRPDPSEYSKLAGAGFENKRPSKEEISHGVKNFFKFLGFAAICALLGLLGVALSPARGSGLVTGMLFFIGFAGAPLCVLGALYYLLSKMITAIAELCVDTVYIKTGAYWYSYDMTPAIKKRAE